MIKDPFKPAQRVSGTRQDVWSVGCCLGDGIMLTPRRSIVNEAAEKSSVKPMVNMGQGFFGMPHVDDLASKIVC